MAIAGRKGKVEIGDNTLVSEIKNWSLDIGSETIDTSCFGVEWKQYIAGIMEWTASAEGMFNVQNDTDGQKALQTAFLNGETVLLKLYVNATVYYSGTAIITSLSIEDDVSDAVTISFEFQGTGELSFEGGF
ncbi:phage tail tube protein [Alkaliphilus peptidifermentans]|uniref:Phage tail tube protein n=1 Tax=Alkaliphilus peptidifermentans DSM 18978 TaxID=1120976 RepID=A0A1G5EE07_9FIRM|nr:phage tail tube protein [Alkaliphilus peptidifermentans]SCY25175.1 Phage tail tube protein [Alkaliphilus peptidifermentans DSM 18978]